MALGIAHSAVNRANLIGFKRPGLDAYSGSLFKSGAETETHHSGRGANMQMSFKLTSAGIVEIRICKSARALSQEASEVLKHL